MKRLLELMMTLMMTLSIAACVNANPSTNDTDIARWPYPDVTPDHIQALSNILIELEPLYNKVAVTAKENGWEKDEDTVQELYTLSVLIEAAKHGVVDPSEYEGTKDMDTVVEQYRAILEAMPDLIDKVSEPFED